MVRDDETMEMFLTLWIHMKHPYRTDVNHFVDIVYGRIIDPCLEDLPLDLHKRAVAIVGVETMLIRFREWLVSVLFAVLFALRSPYVIMKKDEDRINEHLLSDLKVIEAFAMNRGAVGCVFCDGELFRSIAHAMHRQTGLLSRTMITCLIWERGLGTIA